MNESWKRRVVVTGMGAVTPLGPDLERTWAAARDGRSGVRTIQNFDSRDWPVRIGGEIRDFTAAPFLDAATRDFTAAMPRDSQLGLAAAAMALDDAGLNPAGDAHPRWGIAAGAINRFIDLAMANDWRRLASGERQVYPEIPHCWEAWLPQVSLVECFARRWGMAGPISATSTACAASAHALGTALNTIRDGHADLMLAGGFDSMVQEVVVLCFSLLGVLSRRNDEPEKASRPFSRDRDGFVLAEGAAFLVLEELGHARRRGARVYAELAGFGSSMTTQHITDSAADGKGPARAMQRAIADAGLAPHDIDYINAHGTATRDNDRSETIAIRRVLGDHADRVTVSSTKSMTGHLVHATGALEAAFCVLALRDQVVPPTINLDTPDPECTLDYVPHRARPMPLSTVLSNSFAFGGNNASLVFTRPGRDRN
jgi:3-oxoacyl-[acyl-carrier-protein] synthase II